MIHREHWRDNSSQSRRKGLMWLMSCRIHTGGEDGERRYDEQVLGVKVRVS